MELFFTRTGKTFGKVHGNPSREKLEFIQLILDALFGKGVIAIDLC